ncbi:MAG: glutathione S-transferase C-terminal domain-containing protein, partial [Actinobacteria bacterium]|nr:glutathione S-transferase C-terminal domain-containing protein [Actinomycetota bacterium]
RLADEIDELDRWIGPTINQRLGQALYDVTARDQLLAAFARLDRRLAGRRYLLGDAITSADARLWVSLVRYDVGPNAHGSIGPRLESYPDLWRYARDLYAQPAFRDTTRFAAFAAPFAVLPDWDAAAGVGRGVGR